MSLGSKRITNSRIVWIHRFGRFYVVAIQTSMYMNERTPATFHELCSQTRERENYKFSKQILPWIRIKVCFHFVSSLSPSFTLSPALALVRPLYSSLCDTKVKQFQVAIEWEVIFLTAFNYISTLWHLDVFLHIFFLHLLKRCRR